MKLWSKYLNIREIISNHARDADVGQHIQILESA